MRVNGPRFSLLVSLCLIGSVAAYRVEVQTVPVGSAAYHERVAAAAKSSPLDVPPWKGTDVPMMEGEVQLLRPNSQVCRNYVNATNGRVANLLIVQCQDAHDILGHYPPVCYPAHGWVVASESKAKTWTVGGKQYSGMEYEYSRLMKDQILRICVCDFMLLPDGTSSPDMDEVASHARSYRMRYFGAAQVQLQFDAAITGNERDEIFRAIVGSQKALLDRIGSGGTK